MMKLFVAAKRRTEAAEMLRMMQGRLELRPGYLGSWIQERDHPCSHIVYAEHWSSEQALHDHIRSPLFRLVLGVMEISTRAPEVAFYFVSQIKGMELIESLRGDKQSGKTIS